MLPTHGCPLDDLLHAVVDAGVQPEGQAVAGGVDRVDRRSSMSSALKVATCSTGPKTSRSRSSMPSTSRSCGARRRCPSPGVRDVSTGAPLAPCVDIGGDIGLRLGVDHRADIGVERQGSPVTSASIAPKSISIKEAFGHVFLHIEQRSAEQRWPADWKAEATMSRTACSGSAVLNRRSSR
jgi:hypothetical protein